MSRCESRSPNGTYSCILEAGHCGKHEGGMRNYITNAVAGGDLRDDCSWGGNKPNIITKLEHICPAKSPSDDSQCVLIVGHPGNHTNAHCDWSQSDPDTGRKDDQSKPRWDLVPWAALGRVVDVLTYGAAKYSAWNWIKVKDWEARYTAAAFRHLVAYAMGEKIDPESGKSHLACAMCNLLFLEHMGMQ